MEFSSGVSFPWLHFISVAICGTWKMCTKSSFFKLFSCRQRVGNAWKQWEKKIFKSLTKLFEPQRKFVYDGKLAHQSQVPIYIGFSLSDTLNKLPVLLTAAQIILWWLSVQLSHWQNSETSVVQHHLCTQSSQSSSLDPTFNANCNFSCVVLLFPYWTLKAEPLVGRILPLQQMQLCAPAGASRDLLLPSQQPGNIVCWWLGCNSGDHISLLCWRIGNLGQGEATQIMTHSSRAFNLSLIFINRIKSRSRVSARSDYNWRVRV